ncbi:Hypothetical predicted protein, partial [Paramuricea clavata]
MAEEEPAQESQAATGTMVAAEAEAQVDSHQLVHNEYDDHQPDWDMAIWANQRNIGPVLMRNRTYCLLTIGKQAADALSPSAHPESARQFQSLASAGLHHTKNVLHDSHAKDNVT